jgi:Tol biopolymer transport system component
LLPNRDGSDIFIADLTPDGFARRVVGLMRNLTFRYLAPAWSPDGKSIVVKRKREQTGEVAHDLVIRSLDTGEEKFYASSLVGSVLADTGQPSLWSHNGESLLDFGGSSCQGGCFLRTTVKEGQGSLAARFGFSVVNKLAALSPDDRLLYGVPYHTRLSLLARGNELVVFDLSAGKVTERFALPIKDLIREIALSPDGRTMAMWIDGSVTDGQSRLIRIEVDGTGYRELYQGRGRTLAWSKDGRILFGKPDGTDDWQIMKISANGGKEQFTGLRVKGLQSISLSPDGSRLAFDGIAPTVSSVTAR